MRSLASGSARMLSVLRIVTGLLFLEHGTAKLLGFPAAEELPPFDLATLPGWSGIFELVGGALIVLGLFTRPAAFVLSGMMAVAYFTQHFSLDNFYPMNNYGDAAILYCFVFLYLVFAGGGAWSVDRMRGRGGL